MSKTTPLNQLIYALGIPHIGEKAAKAIALMAKTIEGFLALQKDELESIPDFGPIMIRSFSDWMENQKQQLDDQRIDRLKTKPICANPNQKDQGF